MPPSATAVPAMDRNWSLVAAGAVLGCVGVGALFSLAVLLQPMGSDTGWSRAGLSAAMTVAFLASEAGAYITGETLAINGGLYMK